MNLSCQQLPCMKVLHCILLAGASFLHVAVVWGTRRGDHAGVPGLLKHHSYPHTYKSVVSTELSKAIQVGMKQDVPSLYVFDALTWKLWSVVLGANNQDSTLQQQAC